MTRNVFEDSVKPTARRKLFCAIFAVLCAGCGLIWLHLSPKSTSTRPRVQITPKEPGKGAEIAKQEAEAERQKLIHATEAQIKGMMDNAHAQMIEEIEISRGKVENALRGQKIRSGQLISKVDDKLQGYANAVGLVRRLAQDNIRGTHASEDYVKEALQPIIKDQQQTAVEIDAIIRQCASHLDVQTDSLQAGIHQILGITGFNASDLNLEERLQHLTVDSTTQHVNDLLHPASEALTVAIDALIVKSVFRTLATILGNAVGREAASLGIGVGGAAIPFVDIITTTVAVGGTLWSAYDIHKAVDKMKSIDQVIIRGMDESNGRLKETTNDTFSGFEAKVILVTK